MTAGTGHRRAAEALAQALGESYPTADVQCLDVLTYAPQTFHAFYARSYLFLVRHLPWVWKLSYRLLDCGVIYRCVQPVRRAWNLRITRRFVQRLNDQPPDLIVSTHFIPADVCSDGRKKGWLAAPLVVVVTDLYPHRFWISPEADALVVSTPEGASTLRQRGIAESRIHVVGIPIGKAFGQPVDREVLRGRLKLQPERRTVLVTSGGTTVGQFERVVESLIALESGLPGRLQLLIVCGEDEGARARLLAHAKHLRMPTRVLGFVDDMADLMAVSDLMVAKAGGLTISEALGSGLPMILYHIIPGQERMNAEYVARAGAAVIAPRPADVMRSVRQCVEEPGRLEAMARAAKQLGHPRAAEDIVTQVIRPLVIHGR